MVERLARALCRQYELDDGFSPEQADRAAASEMYRNFRAAAKAALSAMLAPTDIMIIAGDERIISALEIREMIAATPTPAEKCFAAMIRAALEETP